MTRTLIVMLALAAMAWVPWARAGEVGEAGMPRDVAQAATLPAATLPATGPVVDDAELRRPPADCMADDRLRQLYREELRDVPNVPPFEELKAAHALLESYFRNASPAHRRRVIELLEQGGIDPNILGRLCRIRMTWADIRPGNFYINEKLGPHQLRYFMGLPPDYTPLRKWPVVIKLPPISHFLTEPPPEAERVMRMYDTWLVEEIKLHPDAVVLMPLPSFREVYGPSISGMNGVIQPLQHLAGRVNVDPTRVYMLGQGSGAHATWNLALHYPTYFAAIAPFAGGASEDWQRLRLMNLLNTLPVVWHDAQDPVVKVDGARWLVTRLRQLKIDADLEETRGMGHAPSDEVYARRYDRMRARARPSYPSEVKLQSNRMETLFNRVDWVQVYQPISPGREIRMLIARSAEQLTMNGSSVRVEAVRDGNRFDLNLGNVGVMRLLVNDLMVDFGKPVYVQANRRAVYEGFPTPSVQIMLHDQLLIGRGWRYFTGEIVLDFLPPPATQPTTEEAR